MDLSVVPRKRLAQLPTPFERMDRLSAHLGHPGLWVKRDDCTGLALGGNKTRKLEFTMGMAMARGANVVVTCGGVQSNHVRQTAAAAAKLGLRCHAVLSGDGADEASNTASGNRLLDDIFDCAVHAVDDEGPATEAKVAELLDRERGNGASPYSVPLGASDGIGSLGYVNCAQELLSKCSDAGIEPGTVVLATGSAGTQAGLLAGLRLAGSSMKVIGISVSEPAEVKRDKVERVLRQLRAVPGMEVKVTDGDIRVLDAYVGAGYAQPTSGASKAIRTLARLEGLLLDPVYTGKAMHGFLDLLESGALPEKREAIFLHTGGAPALFAKGQELLDA